MRFLAELGVVVLVALLGCAGGPKPSIVSSGGSGIASEIARIPAIDDHAHPLRALSGTEKDDEWDPLFAAQEPPASALPARLRVESGEYAGAWRALWGYSGSDEKEAEVAKQRVMAEQGEKYPAWVLDKLGIETMLANRIVMGKGLAAPRFRWVAWADPLLFPLSNASGRRRNAEADAFFAGEEKVLKRYLADAGLAAPPDTLTDYLQRVVTSTLERQKQAGALAVKFEMSYLRSLYVAPATMAAASPVYVRFVKGGEPSADDYKTLQDFLFRFIAHEAGRLGLAVHIHTGAGLGNFYRLSASEPVLLDTVVSDPALRTTTFVLVHGGWPYEKETAYLLGKSNVYADFSAQTFLLSARDLAAVLRTWLGLYPEKVMFGTDAFVLGPGTGWEETGWLSATTARQALGIALGEMTADGTITRARAVELAHMVMHDNAARLYKLGGSLTEARMAKLELVCLDSDDLPHPNSGESNFNESAYYNFYDPACRTGGFVRLGNRPNEGYAEMTTCLYLADGRVAFMFGRPKIADNAAFDAGGMRFDVRTPMREHTIRYEGNVCMMTRPLDLLDPRRAFTENPHKPALLELTYEGLSPAFGGEPREQRDGEWVSVRVEKTGQEFARGHLEQHGHARGRLVVDGVEQAIDGFGLRDRSWGPRYWQGPQYYRWLTMNFGPDHGIAGALTVQRDGRAVQGGYLYERGQPNRAIGRVEVETEVAGDEQLHARVHATLHPADGGPAAHVEGRVLAMVPLRNRRNGVTTRIAEGLTEWRWGDRVGYGWSEYLDHVA